MNKNSRERAGRQSAAARMSAQFSAQFDHALGQAAETMDSFDLGRDDIGTGAPGVAARGDCPPLEFQLLDLERAVDAMLEERDRFMYGRNEPA